jgi:hypothetical protein
VKSPCSLRLSLCLAKFFDLSVIRVEYKQYRQLVVSRTFCFLVATAPVLLTWLILSKMEFVLRILLALSEFRLIESRSVVSEVRAGV